LAVEEKKYKRKKKKVGSYQYGSVIFSITLALFVIGLVGLLVLMANQLTNIVRENFEVSIFLNKNISENQRNRIENELSSSTYLLQRDGEAQIRFQSKEDIAETFIAETGEDFAEFLGDNPFRDALIINIDPEYQEKAKLDSVTTRIKNISGVYEAVYSAGVLEGIEKNKARLSLILLGFAAILLFIVVLLINSTIKLALFSQRFLIRSMQLVGATGSFIRRPFLSRSFMHGAIAGIIASGLLLALLQIGGRYEEQLADVQQEVYVFALYGVLILLGGFIAFISTNWAMNKYLKMSLDELY